MTYGIDISLGSYRNLFYLVSDLPVKHVVATEWDEHENSPCLSTLCPEGYTCIDTWCGQYEDIDKKHNHNWANVVETWNRNSDSLDLGIILSPTETPMMDFEYLSRLRVRGRAIYVENGKPRSKHCNFEYDIHALANMFPLLTFYCTADPQTNLPNVVNCSNRNLVELSFISNYCEAIVGKGSGPFLCTYTEMNRKKPRAVVGYYGKPFWQYRGNPLKYLKNEYELISFLKDVNSQPFVTV